MPNVNTVLLIGHAARDVEVRTSAKGTKWATFTIAVSGDKRDDGKEPSATFVDCKCFGAYAERLEGARKGDTLLIQGKLELERWEDKATKQPRSKLVVIGLTVHADFVASQEKVGKPGGAHSEPPIDSQEEAPF